MTKQKDELAVPSQQQANVGHHGRAIQIIGNNNTIGDTPHLTIYCPPQQRRVEEGPAKDDAALLRPGIEATNFVGRAALIENFLSWAREDAPERPVSVRVVYGGAGVGKTRFAVELCRELGPNWQAGFVDAEEARRFLGQTNLGNWGWQKPTLVVFDYAMALVDFLPQWFEELCTISTAPHPLRLLLLERDAQEDSGWLGQVFSEGPGFRPEHPRDLLDGSPFPLPGLNDPEMQCSIMVDVLTRLQSPLSLPFADANFQKRLAETNWAGAPLYLMMAAMVMHQQGCVGDVLHLGRVDLALAVAEHEYKRFDRACCGNVSLRLLLPHLAAFATLCGGMESGRLMDCVRREKVRVGCESVDSAVAVSLLAELLPDGKEGIAPIQPDIVGEAFLLKRLAGGRQAEGGQAVLRAFGDRPSEVAAALVRCVQDFVPLFRTPMTEKTKEAHKKATSWLRAIAETPEMPLNKIIFLIDEIPNNSISLRALASDIAQSAVDRCRKIVATDHDRVLFAAILNRLANCLRDIGKIQQSITASTEGIENMIHVSKIDNEKYLDMYASLLTTHAISLSYENRHEGALSSISIAIETRRFLFERNNTKYIRAYFISMNTNVLILGRAGKHKESLDRSLEVLNFAKSIYEIDTSSNRDLLASALANASNRLFAIGEIKISISLMEKSIHLYIILSNTNPDSFQTKLVDCYAALSERYEALKLKEKATKAARISAKLLFQIAFNNPALHRNTSNKFIEKWLSLHYDISADQAHMLYQKDPKTYLRVLIDDTTPPPRSNSPEGGF